MSTETDALVAFFRARLDEEQTSAEAAQISTPGARAAWEAAPMHDEADEYSGWRVVVGGRYTVVGNPTLVNGLPIGIDRPIAQHIARHDPARVLADVEADRDLLDQYERLLRSQQAHEAASAELQADMDHRERTGEWAGVGFPDVRLRALRREDDYLTAMRPVLERWVKAKAARHADHEDYQESWRP